MEKERKGKEKNQSRPSITIRYWLGYGPVSGVCLP